MGPKARFCKTCQSTHFPPTGQKCDMLMSEDGYIGREEDGGAEGTYALDFPDLKSNKIDWSCWPPTQGGIKETGYKQSLQDNFGRNRDYEVNSNKAPASDPLKDKSEWPPLRGKNDPGMAASLLQPKSENVWDSGRDRSIHTQIPPSEFWTMKDEVKSLQESVHNLSRASQSSTDKLSRIEGLLQQVVSRHDGIPAPPDNTNPRQGHTPPGASAPPDDVRGRSSTQGGGKHHYRQKQTPASPASDSYASDSSDCSSSPHSHKRSSRHKGGCKRKSTYELSRFLPKEERDKPMNTEKLWYCHGALMLEMYKRGEKIEGMLEHNCFIAEKTATRAYLGSGICRYDEAVREKAYRGGMDSYGSGDMGLAMRFLTTEYARTKQQTPSNQYTNRGQGPRKGQGSFHNPSTQRERGEKIICWNFNSSGCSRENCRYPHICSKCFGSSHSQHTCRVPPTNSGNPPASN